MNKKNKGQIKNRIMESLSYLKESRQYIYFSVYIFLFFAVLGFFFPVPDSIRNSIMEFIKELIFKTENLSHFGITKFILLNNLQSSFFGMIFGILLGVFPFLVAAVNGYLIGVVSYMAIKQEGILILWRLLPHGIFELPAIFISLGLGIKLGTVIFRKDRVKVFRKYLTNSLLVFLIVVVPLLIVAAIIEGALIYFM